ALLGELLFGPAAGDDDPGTGLLAFRGLTDFLQRLLQRRHADPVHLGTERQRGADAMDVPVREARNDGAVAEVDQLCLVACEFLSFTPKMTKPYPSILRNSAFATFSSVERGISSTKRISRGTLKSASELRHAAITVSCRFAGSFSTPSCGMMKTTGTSSSIGCFFATTAASRTPGTTATTCSI